MVTLNRVRATWNGAPGLPGVSTFYCKDPAVFVPAVRQFFVSVASTIPDRITIQVEAFGDTIDDQTGDLNGSWNTAAVLPVQGSNLGAGTYSAPSGATIQWITSAVVQARRLRGRTFIVPLGGSAYEGDGTISPASLVVLRTAAAALVTVGAANFVVWGRPQPAIVAEPPLLDTPARLGTSADVTASVVRDVAAVLRSRRD